VKNEREIEYESIGYSETKHYKTYNETKTIHPDSVIEYYLAAQYLILKLT